VWTTEGTHASQMTPRTSRKSLELSQTKPYQDWKGGGEKEHCGNRAVVREHQIEWVLQ